MLAPVNVVEVTAMSIGTVNASSDDFCHFTTVPILPLKVRFAGEVPEQIVWFGATAPPTVVGSKCNTMPSLELGQGELAVRFIVNVTLPAAISSSPGV